jgi:hypothetical protein
MEKLVVEHPEQAAAEPIQSYQRNTHRWILYLFLVAVLVGAVYAGWLIVKAWQYLIDQST